MLAEDGVILNENKYLLASLTKACKLKNDRVLTRLPIQKGVLKILLGTTKTYFYNIGQPYLSALYKALFVAAYFGLLRVSELTKGPHAVLAKNVNIGDNKNKILFKLESSKTHGKDKKPQLVKIASKVIEPQKRSTGHYKWQDSHKVCAFSTLRGYLKRRPIAVNHQEQFFVFADNSPVTESHMRNTLRLLLTKSGLSAHLYNTHSFRIGRCCDLLKMGFEVPTIQKIGRWRSNAVYIFLR